MTHDTSIGHDRAHTPVAPPPDDVLLTASGLCVSIGGALVIDHVDLQVARGQIVSLIGPNGSGKTTLVRTMLGLRPANGGRAWRKPGLTVGYVPQRLTIDAALPLTVRRFLAMAGGSAERSAEVLSELGIGHTARRPVQELSGGEWQRVLLARSILRRPDVLVLDEPAQGVDVMGQNELYAQVRQLRDRLNCGVLLVSHDLHLVMASTDEVICLNHHICCTGRPEVVAQHPAYVELFGRAAVNELAVYRHQHDHVHGPADSGHGHGHAAHDGDDAHG